MPNQSTRPNRPQRATWHRKASKPIYWWMLGLVGFSLVHWAVPDYRWLLIHMFTLGIVTNSIVLWSQHFTEKFLHQPLDDAHRPWQLRRIWVLNVGIVLILAGQLVQYWHPTTLGATLVGSVLLVHSYLLWHQYRQAKAGQRYAPSVVGYVCSAAFLPTGAVLGALLAVGLPTAWQEQLRLAHLVLNVLGFVGLAAISSLMLLFPAVWRTQAGPERPRTIFSFLVSGTMIAALGAGFGHIYVTVAGLSLYLVGLMVAIWGFAHCVLRVLADPRDRLSFASLSVAAAPLWLFGSLLVLIIRCVQAEQIADVSLPTMSVLIGFAAQLLIGVMCYLLPSRIGGGPSATRTGMAILDRGGVLRSTLLNFGLPMWLYTENSWLRIVLSLFVFGSLAVFIVLSPLAAKAQLGVLRKTREPLALVDQPRSSQLAIGLGVLALTVASFGGLVNTLQSDYPTNPNAPVTRLQIEIEGMTFNPNVATAPVGSQLVVIVTNNDTLAHDLKFDNGAKTGRINPGESTELFVGTVEGPMTGWCTIAGHRAQGMELSITTGDSENASTTSVPQRPMEEVDNGIDPSLDAVTVR